MSVIKRGAKIVARAVAEEFSWRAGENVGRAIGEAIGQDAARAYRRWRNLPEPGTAPNNKDGES